MAGYLHNDSQLRGWKAWVEERIVGKGAMVKEENRLARVLFCLI